MTRPGVLDLFAGVGGWHLALPDAIGVELDPAACDTARAAGHRMVAADVTADNLDVWGRTYRGLVAGPPCQGFSPAGKGKGRDDAGALLEAMNLYLDDAPRLDPREWARARMTDHRSILVLEPLRYAVEAARAHQPFEWLAWEQVTTVLPLWQRAAEVLRTYGYDVQVAIVNAETAGVGQTRRRAILRATLDGPLRPLSPTHSRYHTRSPKKLDAGMPRWRSMRDVLGDRLPVSGSMGDVRNAHGCVRPVDAPSPTLTSSSDNGNFQWLEPGQTRGRAITVAEVGALQGFPIDYPWQGTREEQFRQAGNAIPPPLAALILDSLEERP